MISWLTAGQPFPPVDTALDYPNGLLAAGGDLSPATLLCAYRQGIFPWFSPEDPILWWCPDPRMVLYPQKLKISRSFKRALRQKDYEIRIDSAFVEVMKKCAEPRDGQRGTWITGQMIDAYSKLHELGIAHSVETWSSGILVGGLYGISLGKMFFGESMFSRKTDASKIAFAHLVRFLEKEGVAMIDCQMKTAHLESLGAEEIPRELFCRLVAELTSMPDLAGNWRMNHEF